MATMKAVVLHQAGDLRYEDAAVPVPGDRDVLVRVMFAGVCGSDIERVIKGSYFYPVIPGHEFCGVVAGTGPAVTGFRADARVVVVPLIPCWTCDFCRRGLYSLCDNYGFLGSRANGGFARYAVVPEANLLPLPANIDYIEGALVEPAAVALHGILKLDLKAGQSVCILGAGTLGLLCLQWARLLGAGKIIISDVAAGKLNLAAELGADAVINAARDDVVAELHRLTGAGGVDAVIEAAGQAATQEQALKLVRKQGKVLFLGLGHEEVVFSQELLARVVRGELTLMGSWNSYSAPFPGREWEITINTLQQGRLKLKALVSHIEPLARAPALFRKLAGGELEVTKLLLVP